jgi:hypothetical protein
MAKKEYFLTVDVESTMDGKVADFAAVISDRKGDTGKRHIYGYGKSPTIL